MTWRKVDITDLSQIMTQEFGPPMPTLSKTSQQRLSTCDPRLQVIVIAAIKRIDFTVLCGHRGQQDQDDAVARGFSKTPWPKSKHNSLPSAAVDLAPYPIDWHNLDRFKALAMIMIDEAHKAGTKIRWGGDFNRNGLPDDKFIDMPHFELDE